jgi:nucleoside 2-deoxyribosyltransferase
MPFSEKTDQYATGFFDEVFASLFKPAIEAAGFVARTAKRQGSDVIHATIVNELLDADLVLADLTEHNPNVLFELGLRMAKELPIALVRAKGTNPIFDVDNMLRVEAYNPNLWSSTVEKDVPRLTAHIQEAWSRKDGETTYLSMLRRT